MYIAFIKQSVIDALVVVKLVLLINPFKYNDVGDKIVNTVLFAYCSEELGDKYSRLYLRLTDISSKLVVEFDRPYLTLLTPSPTDEVVENLQPNDIDHTPLGMFNKLAPVTVFIVVIKGTEFIDDFIVKPIAFFGTPNKCLAIMSPFVLTIYKYEPSTTDAHNDFIIPEILI